METERLVRVSPDGQMLTFLFHDQSCLLDIGDPTIIRASHVRFDNSKKKWFVFLRDSTEHGIEDIRQELGFDTREKAIQFELKLCQALLEKAPERIDRLIAEHVQEFDTSQ